MRNLIVLNEYKAKKAVKNDTHGIWVTEFTESSAKSFVDSVRKVTEEDDEQPIIVYIDSYGGQVDACMSMLTILDSVPNQVITVSVGKSMSCGAMLLSHGDIRFASPRTRIMVHEISGGTRGNANDIKVDASETLRLNKYWNKLMAENCGYKTVKEFEALFTNETRDLYLDAKSALKFGVVDKIGFPKLEKQVKYNLVF